MSSRRSPSHESPDVVAEHDNLSENNHIPHESFGETDVAILSPRLTSIRSPVEARHHVFSEPQDRCDPLKHKEDAVLASLKYNAESLHAALMEIGDDANSVHASYEESDEGLHESGFRTMNLLGLSSVTPALLPNDDMPSAISSACSNNMMPRFNSEQVSLANVPIAPLFSMKPWISFRLVFAAVIFLSVPSGMFAAL